MPPSGGGGMVTVSQAKAEPISPLSAVAGMTHPLPNATPPLLLPPSGNLPPNSPAMVGGGALTSTAVFESNPNLLAQESQLLVSSPF